MMQLTGRRRYRSQKRIGLPALLVLQVEERGPMTTCIVGQINCEYVSRWRDAHLEDLTRHERTEAAKE